MEEGPTARILWGNTNGPSNYCPNLAWLQTTFPTYSLLFRSPGPLRHVLRLTALSAEREGRGREWCTLGEWPIKGWEKGWVSSNAVFVGKVATGVLRLSPGDQEPDGTQCIPGLLAATQSLGPGQGVP